MLPVQTAKTRSENTFSRSSRGLSFGDALKKGQTQNTAQTKIIGKPQNISKQLNGVSYSNGGNQGAGQSYFSRDVIKSAYDVSGFAYDDAKPHYATDNSQTYSSVSKQKLGLNALPNGITSQNGLYSNDRDGTQLLVTETNNSIIVGFRGTEPDKINDIVQDLKLPSYQFNGGLGPVGNFQDVLNAAGRYSAQTDRNLIVTGHSLGGWLTNTTAENAEALHPSYANASYVAFSSPMFARNDNVLNVGYENDPVYGLTSTSTHTGNIYGTLYGQPDHVEGVQFGYAPKSPSAHSLGNLASLVTQLTS